MLNNPLAYLKFGTTYCGIEHSHYSGEERIFSVLLKKKKDELDLQHTAEVNDLEQLAGQLPKKQHAFLVVNTDQVLTKEVAMVDDNSQKTLNTAFPNIQLNQFYFQILPSGGKSFVSICRKDIVDGILKRYEAADIAVIGFGLGALGIAQLLPFIDGNGTLVTSNSTVHMKDGSLQHIEKHTDVNSESYAINGLEITGKHLLSFAGALQYYFNTSLLAENGDEERERLLDDYTQDRFFSLFSKFALGSILTILLINFLLFNFYFNNVNDFEQLQLTNTANQEQLVELKDAVGKKQQLAENLLAAASSKSSQRIDQVIKQMPASILLEELDYNPLQKRIKESEAILIDDRHIAIKGQSREKVEFTNWINKLEKLPWVASVVTNNYSEQNKTADFAITLLTKDE